MNNFDMFKEAYLKCLTESDNNSVITVEDLDNLKDGDIITIENFRGKKKKYHFAAFVVPEQAGKPEREIFVHESHSSINIKLPDYHSSGLDLIAIEKADKNDKSIDYTFFITSVSDSRYTYYAIGCTIGFKKPNYASIQKRMGEKYFADYYTNGIKKSFKSYDSLVKFCKSLQLSSDIPTEKVLVDNSDNVFYIS